MGITVSGPLWDGRAYAAVDDACEDIKDELGLVGLENVHQVLDARIRVRTPYYETQLITEQMGDEEVVHDGDPDIRYGWWLEGVGERNRTTRFKGYHAFRIATKKTQKEAKPLAERIVAWHIPRMT